MVARIDKAVSLAARWPAASESDEPTFPMTTSSALTGPCPPTKSSEPTRAGQVVADRGQQRRQLDAELRQP